MDGDHRKEGKMGKKLLPKVLTNLRTRCAGRLLKKREGGGELRFAWVSIIAGMLQATNTVLDQGRKEVLRFVWQGCQTSVFSCARSQSFFWLDMQKTRFQSRYELTTFSSGQEVNLRCANLD